MELAARFTDPKVVNNTSAWSQVQRRPNFFVVGAPKCGTTSMYHFLRTHPDIFMPYDNERFWKAKEPHHLADDLGITAKGRIESKKNYFELFQGARHERRIGEASALYFYSASAAERIKNEFPNAKVIIMLRPPLELMLSWHQDCLRFGHDDISDFEHAIEAEEARKNGQRIPEFCIYPSRLIYTEMGAYLTYVQRYLQIMGESNVKIFLLEDLHRDPSCVYKETLEFLELDSSYEPDFKVYHRGSQHSSSDVGGQKLKLMILKKARPIFDIFQRLSPEQQDRIRNLYKMALPKKPPPENSPEFLNNLRLSFTDEVEELGKLLNRDLSHWLQPANE